MTLHCNSPFFLVSSAFLPAPFSLSFDGYVNHRLRYRADSRRHDRHEQGESGRVRGGGACFDYAWLEQLEPGTRVSTRAYYLWRLLAVWVFQISCLCWMNSPASTVWLSSGVLSSFSIFQVSPTGVLLSEVTRAIGQCPAFPGEWTLWIGALQL